MSSIVFKLDQQGVRDLLQGAEMQQILREYGNAKAQQAGDGYECDVHVYSKRAVANVFPNTAEAANDNYENNTLLKVIGG